MKKILCWVFLAMFLFVGELNAQESSEKVKTTKSKLTFGGYGEVVMSNHFYSDNYLRYSKPDIYKNADGYGRMDIPHAVFTIGYDFGQGWSLSTEIEFEHGGTETAIEIEDEETGEYEKEIGKGGKIRLEQFWIQKTYSKAANLRMGQIIIPVGFTNQYHLPNQYFGVYRPEGESTIMPSTWSEIGVSLWGRSGDWRYEAMFIAGLDADRFGDKNWIKGGAGSPYEFKIANSYAGAFRLDNYTVSNLRVGVSGYYGHSAKNSLKSAGYSNLTGAVMIASADAEYNANNIIIRGSYNYGTLSDSEAITAVNLSQRNDSPSPKTPIGSAAISYGVEAGYDVFSMFSKMHDKHQKLYVFSRYEYYDSMHEVQGTLLDNKSMARTCISLGLNYCPMKQIVIKAEYQSRRFASPFNNENTFLIAFTYAGLFTR